MMNETTPMNECVRQRERDGTDTARNREKGRKVRRGGLGSREGSRFVAF